MNKSVVPIALSAVIVIAGVTAFIVIRRGSGKDDRKEEENRQAEVAIPEQVANPEWLAKRKQDQLKTTDQFQVVHDFQFTDERRKSGITFRNTVVDDAGKWYTQAHYDHGNGLAVADVDGDGMYDIYFVTQAGSNELWRNLGGGKFENITEKAGVAVADRIGVTASFVDTDNDGDADLYVTTVRHGNLLFENDGTGTFRDISQESGLAYVGHSSSAVFFDYNRDGRVDLFLTNVGQYTTDRVAEVSTYDFSKSDKKYHYFSSFPDAFSGHLKPKRAEPSLLFENKGDNHFEDVTAKTKLQDVSWSGDASPLDANDDGWLDLYVLNMQGGDEYYENVEGKYFERKSRAVFPKTPWGTMGIKVFDFNNDGQLDVYLTDMHSDMSPKYCKQMTDHVDPLVETQKAPRPYAESFLKTDATSIFGNALYRKDGKQQFTEVSDAMGVENLWPWGPSVGDFNADGFEDIFVASSMNYPYRYAVNSLLLNNKGVKFLAAEFLVGVEPREGGRTATPWFELDCEGDDAKHPLSKDRSGRLRVVGALGSRSSVIFDLDNDGDLDIVTNDFNSEPMVLVSNLAEKKQVRFLKIRLVGSVSNRFGLGAQVQVRCGQNRYTKVQDGQSGYLSQSLLPLYFGLGDSSTVDDVEVVWPSGKRQQIPGPIEVNKLLTITETND